MAPDDSDERTEIQDRIDEAINGGGCCQTWEAMVELRESGGRSSGGTGGLPRRGLLQRAAGGLATLPVLSPALDGAGKVAADAFVARRDLPTGLPPNEQARAIREFRRTPEYRRLIRHGKSGGIGVRFTPAHATVVRGQRPSGETYTVAYAPLRNAGADRAYLTMARAGASGGIDVAGLEYVETAVRTPGVGSHPDAADAPSAEVPVRARLVDATDGSLDERTVRVGPGLQSAKGQRGHRHRSASIGKSTVANMGFFCTTCVADVGFICQFGCGTPLWALCGFLGLTTVVGGITCVGFVSAVCTAVAIYGCGMTGFAERVCSTPPFDFCNKQPLW